MKVRESPICQNPRCHKPMIGKRSDTKFCSNRCRAAVKQNDQEAQEEVWISSACRFPKQQQAEIALGDRAHRHPVPGKRPEWSGYCVVPDRCGCTREGCHGPGEFAAMVEVTR